MQPAAADPLLRGKGSIVKVEDRAVGRVTPAVYRAYLSAWSAFYLIPAIMLGFSLAQQGAVVRPCATAQLHRLQQKAALRRFDRQTDTDLLGCAQRQSTAGWWAFPGLPWGEEHVAS